MIVGAALLLVAHHVLEEQVQLVEHVPLIFIIIEVVDVAGATAGFWLLGVFCGSFAIGIPADRFVVEDCLS